MGGVDPEYDEVHTRPVVAHSERTIREWTFHEEIGRGAIGVIWRATHRFHGGEFAIKALRPERSRQEEIRERFLREANTAVGLRHPNIVETLVAFEDGGMLYLPMERLRGNALRTLMQAHRAVWPADVARHWIAGAARGLAHAHAQGITHRDVKPGNLFVLDDGRTTKLLDFGLARTVMSTRLTATGTTVGTPNYLAPEVIDGEDATAASDIYALGVVLFRMLTMRLPFDVPRSDNPFAIAHAIRAEQDAGLPSPRRFRADLPADLDALIAQMIALDPQARPSSATEVARRLDVELANAPEIALRIHPRTGSEPPSEIPRGLSGADALADRTTPDRPSALPDRQAERSTADLPRSEPVPAPDASTTDLIRPPVTHAPTMDLHVRNTAPLLVAAGFAVLSVVASLFVWLGP